MEIQRVYQLSQTEFDAIKGTELFSVLVSHKFSVTLPPSSSAISSLKDGQDLAEFVEMHVTGPWYVCVELRGDRFNKYTYYFSNEEDACFFEKDALQCES